MKHSLSRIAPLVTPILVLILWAASFTPSPAQTSRKPLGHDVYDGWNRISGETISRNGEWIAYVLEPQEGDPRLIVYHTTNGMADTIAYGSDPRFSYDSRHLAFTLKAHFADVRKAKIAKKKGDDLPKDSLGIIQLGTHGVTSVPRVKSFRFPEKGSGWIAYQLEKDVAKPDSSAQGRRKSDALDEGPDDADKKDDQGTTVIARDLATGTEITFPMGLEYAFAKDGSRLLVASTAKDSTIPAGVFALGTATKRIDTLAIGKGKFKQVAVDDNGGQAVFYADRDTSKSKQRYFRLCYWKSGEDSAAVIADTTTTGLPKGWLLSENRTPDFSDNGQRIIIGTAPVPMPEDTSFNDEVTAKLDVWNWQDGFIQTHQLNVLTTEKKRSYTAVVVPSGRSFRQLGGLDLPTAEIGDKGNAPVALGLNDVPYRKEISWENTGFADVYLVDVATGGRTKILERLHGSAFLSPYAHFIVWYDVRDRHWYTIDTQSQKRVRVTDGITVPLCNELNDLPDDPGPYGIAGWVGRDSLLLVYDRYDIWLTDPSGKQKPVNLTQGRKQRLTYRYVRFDPDERTIAPSSSMFLRVFDNTTKGSGYATLGLQPQVKLHSLLMADADWTAPKKALDANRLLMTRSTFTEFPDLRTGTLSCDSIVRISTANPQQGNYLWGSVELVSWKAADGKPLEGLLYKPDGFDPAKKYPMIVYYYERNSDLLHRFVSPAPSASTINFSYCVSNGYLVFVPDIRYRVGYPGQSAVDCIVPGVQSLIKRGCVDPARIALQGQSWGGYQTAFLVTRTPMFRCAFAGAPVSNMTSAYGGIRWESGLVRIFQYERAQSRIGATLWQKPELYIENSPLFRADKVTTPLLIMSNDNDGAVPWYQGIELFNALRRLGKQTWMLTYNTEAHNLVQRKNRKDLSIRMMQFFDHFLKDAPMPVWMSKGIPAVNKGKTLGYELQDNAR